MSLWLCTSPEDTPRPNMALDYGTFTIYAVPVTLTYGALSRFLLFKLSPLLSRYYLFNVVKVLMALNDCPQGRWRVLRPTRLTRPMKKLPN
jgi:hypothetical protein